MEIKHQRDMRGWSQEDLAAASGVSARTIQRIEKGQTPGPETIRSIASAFGTDVETLRKGHEMEPHIDPAKEENVKGLLLHLIVFAVLLPILALVAVLFTPYPGWIGWVAVFWLVGLGLHAATVRIWYGPFRLF